ncbi:MAG: gluconokinase [Saprospiraceae bacterium]
MENLVIYIMGVSGSGKSTIGKLLAEKVKIPFYDGDDFHTNSNKEKMASGVPLSDEDRLPWLNSIRTFAFEKANSQSLIIACSALKQSYRDILSNGIEESVKWIHLYGNHELILKRMQKRTGHFMPSELLQSQYDTLEIPENALTISIENKPEEIILQIINYLEL